MGEQKQRPTHDDRKMLVDVIPLDTPLGVNIETVSACNFKCRFCVHALEKKDNANQFEKGIMDFELYKKIIDDMTGFHDRPKMLTLAVRGEPLLHPEIGAMISYAKEKNVVDKVNLLTNASMMTPDVSDKLIAAGIDELLVSIEGLSDEDYEDIAGVKVNFQEIVENVRYFYEHKRKDTILYVKIISMGDNAKNFKKFKSVFASISDRYYLEHLDSSWQSDIEVNVSKEEMQTAEKRYEALSNARRKICPDPFYKMIVLQNGLVAGCIEDYKEEMIMGDLKTENIVDVWNGKKLNDLRYAQATGLRDKYPLCMTDCFKYKDIHNPKRDHDNIDHMSEEVINYFDRMRKDK